MHDDNYQFSQNQLPIQPIISHLIQNVHTNQVYSFYMFLYLYMYIFLVLNLLNAHNLLMLLYHEENILMVTNSQIHLFHDQTNNHPYLHINNHIYLNLNLQQHLQFALLIFQYNSLSHHKYHQYTMYSNPQEVVLPLHYCNNLFGWILLILKILLNFIAFSFSLLLKIIYFFNIINRYILY